MAFGGLMARRGEPERGERRAPNVRQWFGTRRRSHLGKAIGTVCHADQYAAAARASHERTACTLVAPLTARRAEVIVSTTDESPNASRAIRSWPASLCSISR